MENQNKLSQDQSKTIDEIEVRLKEIKERTVVFVKKNPLTSIAIAAVFGYFIGKIFSGRRQ